MFDVLIHRWLHIPYALHTTIIKSSEKTAATVLFIHGIGNSGQVWKPVIAKLPKDIRVVTIDLLGFGQSPHPTWALYDAKTQARSVLATYIKLRLRGQIVVVGHSLGALVAVEVAKRYPLLIRSLVLCSPPFYKITHQERRFFPRSDKVLKSIYETVQKYPDQFVQIASVAMKYKLINSVFNVTNGNIDSYMSALGATIVNQTSLADAKKLRVPIEIIRGTLDPVVVVRNLKELEASRSNVTLVQVVASHEVAGLMVGATVTAIRRAYAKSSDGNKPKKH